VRGKERKSKYACAMEIIAPLSYGVLIGNRRYELIVFCEIETIKLLLDRLV
jgi:hypothetical protein